MVCDFNMSNLCLVVYNRKKNVIQDPFSTYCRKHFQNIGREVWSQKKILISKWINFHIFYQSFFDPIWDSVHLWQKSISLKTKI